MTDNVFQRFDINTADISLGTIEKLHAAYHAILDSIESKKEENGDLATRKNKVMNEWLKSCDLDPDTHDAVDELEQHLLDITLSDEGNPRMLPALYKRVLALTSEIKRHMEDQIARVANPGGRSQFLGTKQECKELRTVATSLANVYGTIQMMNSDLPDLPNLEWRNIPPGRDVTLSAQPYKATVVKYSLSPDGDDFATKGTFLRTLNYQTGVFWTRYEFDKYIESKNFSLREDADISFTDANGNEVTVYQRVFSD